MGATCQTANATGSGDPTNTRSLRRGFIAELKRRMRSIRGDVRRSIGSKNDALRLSEAASAPVANEERESFSATSREAKLTQFTSWLRGLLEDNLVDIVAPGRVSRGENWTAEFVRKAYLQGWDQATGNLFQRGVSVRNPDTDDILQLPTPRSQLQDLYQTVFEALRDVAHEEARTIRSELARGLIDGDNPREMAGRLNEKLESITRNRLATIARTTIIDSHSTATLDRYEDAGVDVVSHGEWTTAGDDRVCSICEALEGKLFTIQEMRDATFTLPGVDFDIQLRPPAHPNGRCVILPVIGADPPTTPLQERLPSEPVEA
jgi:SPP1 gp7 family putative phage head morphogenesis protein